MFLLCALIKSHAKQPADNTVVIYFQFPLSRIRDTLHIWNDDLNPLKGIESCPSLG